MDDLSIECVSNRLSNAHLQHLRLEIKALCGRNDVTSREGTELVTFGCQ